MDDNNRIHFRVPIESIRTKKINRTGRTKLHVRENYAAHGNKLIERTNSIIAESYKSIDNELTNSLFVQIITPEDIPIRTAKQQLEKIDMEVISYLKDSKNKGIAKITSENVKKFEKRLREYVNTSNNIGKYQLSLIEDISLVPIEEKIAAELMSNDENITFNSILYFYSELEENEKTAIIEKTAEYLRNKGDKLIDSKIYSTGIATAVVNTSLKTLKELGRDFRTLKLITPDRVFFVTNSTPLSSFPQNIKVNSPNTNIIVALIDSGVQSKCGVLSPLITGKDYYLPSGSSGPHLEHGTFVASRILYGDEIEAKLQETSITPNCRLLDVAVIGKSIGGEQSGLDEQNLASAIDNAVSKFTPEIRVVNISLGSDVAIQDYSYSLVAKLMDQLSREKDILFVTTAGNIRDHRMVASYPTQLQSPRWRIDLPGESLLAVTVGSIAKKIYQDSISGILELSPFSRVGPGADGGIKPELVEHGGNCRKNGLPISYLATQGIYGNGSNVAWDFGTSFSAPIVSGIAAQLFGALGAPTTNLVKALLIHFADSAVAPANANNKLMCVGFGLPNLNNSLFATDSSAAFLFEGKIDRENYLFIPFYVPKKLASSNKKSGFKLKCTLVYDPPVQDSNEIEYSCAKISLKIVKPTTNQLMEVSLSKEDIISRLDWNPIIKFEKSFLRSYLHGEWFIKLKLWARGPSINFLQRVALVIEIIDELKDVDVWNEIANETGNKYRIAIQKVA